MRSKRKIKQKGDCGYELQEDDNCGKSIFFLFDVCDAFLLGNMDINHERKNKVEIIKICLNI